MIGGVRVKIFILSYLKELGGTKAFYRMSKLIFVQKLLHFKVRNFGRISYKKMKKSQILRYITPNVSQPSIFA